MMWLGLMGLVGLVATDPGASVTDQEMAAYRATEAKAGRDPESHVKLALWCESHGLDAERTEHLAIAVLLDPSHAAARGLLGLVPDAGGRWHRPEDLAEMIRADADRVETLAEYNARRARVAPTQEAHWKLALWCESHGLDAEARAHFTAVTRLPSGARPKARPRSSWLGVIGTGPAPRRYREAAWKKLGCRLHHGRWLTDDQIAAEVADAEAQARANDHWRTALVDLKADLNRPSTRDEAEKALAGIEDPRAVPMTWQTFARGGRDDQSRAVQVLGQIASPQATKGLAVLATLSRWPEVRRAATETLTRRDSREYVGPLIGLLSDILEYEVRPVGGPGAPGMLFVEGERFNIRRLYDAPPPPEVPLEAGDIVTFDPSGLPVINRATLASARVDSPRALPPGERVPPTRATRPIRVGKNQAVYRRALETAQNNLIGDIRQIEARNDLARDLNGPILAALDAVTGRSFGEDRQAWMAWWTDQQGYAYARPQAKPTFDQQVPLGYNPNYSTQAPPHHSCFAAGTPVHTLDGPRPIETLKVGDVVLSQDTATGALSVQPILAVFHNPPNETYRLRLEGGESIVATGIHRLWKAGRGWIMAREVKPGDALRTRSGLDRVAAVEHDATPRPVFNLEVAESHTFFVGGRGLLAHDNSLVAPVDRPFDASPTLAALGGSD